MIDGPKRRVALLVAGCAFMQNLDGTIVTTAAPKIGSDLHVSAVEISLVITAYLITFAVLIPLGGWLVASFGTRRVFLGAVALFTGASLACAFSNSLGVLVAMRVLQGAGGAIMVPTGRIVALSGIEKTDILRIMAYIVWPSLIAPVIAPLAGGLIVTYASWRWLFLLNLPLGVVALAIGLRIMPALERPARQRLDGVGLALSAIGLGGLTYSAHLVSSSTAGALVGAVAAVSIGALVLARWHLMHAPRPLLDLHLFAIRTFRAANGGWVLFSLVVSAVPFLLPLLFQTVFGWSAIKSGTVVLFVFIGNIAIKPATTYLLNTFRFKTVLVVATAGVALSMIAAGLFSASTPVVIIAAVSLFNGIVRSTGFTAYMSLGFSDVPEAQMRDANVLSATVQQLGAGLAIAGGAVALHVGHGIAAAMSTHPAPVNAYTAAFFLLAVIALLASALAACLPGDAGDAVRVPQAKVPTEMGSLAGVEGDAAAPA
jgi:EmrB/QacA subfamily drug resistance transporter